ncbi:MAG: hypothetical protein QM763_16820 [Agriterribacter sp.]
MGKKGALAIFEIIIIVLFAVIPLLVSFPYRVNIFLSWEGAYRISNGEIPFRDFGIPLGGMYWVIPAIFFKIFGSQMITLIKAQVFINIISGLAFRSILKSLNVPEGVRLASVLLYCLSFSFLNYWPWYNHTVIVYAFISLSFIVKIIMWENEKRKLLLTVLSALFTFFAIFTKQDGGGLIFLIAMVLLVYYGWLEKKWKYLFLYLGGTFLFVFMAVLFLGRYDFSYWFNHGQPPHNARVSVSDLLNTFFGSSQWLKLYFFLAVIASLPQLVKWKTFIRSKRDMTFFLLTVGILCMASIFQVTSYTPDICNFYYHSFAFAYFISVLIQYLPVQINAAKLGLILSTGVLLWWSKLYWNYMQRIFKIYDPPATFATSSTGENIVNVHNARLAEEDNIKDIQGAWVSSSLKTLRKISIPENTAKGIERFMSMDLVKNKKDIRVLNMSELTSLAAEVPYRLETGINYPLWFHLGVGMFNRELKMFEDRIVKNQYDVVLFEYIPTLNNFYPFDIRNALLSHYQKIDSFPAPRSTDPGTIEIYIK